MDKKLFIESLKIIEEQSKKDLIYRDKLADILHPHIEPYDNSLLENQLLKILKNEFELNVSGDDSMIEYFIYELDFGRKYSKGCFKVKDKPVDISSSDKLWDYLNLK